MAYKKYDVKRMAEALQKGAVMMAIHCEACGAPLFRYKTGRIECVNCGRLYRYAPGSGSVEELSKLEYNREEALSLLREIEKHLFTVEDELKIKSIVETLKKIRDELVGTG
ncbi:MAG: Sjogren's syndrome/scleroderma autoantigen 1 family protein [Nitrososphaeria archaeon]